MAQITYADKSTMNENSSIPATNKCQASDMNEIKSVVNGNYNEVGNITNLTTTNKTNIVDAVNEVNSNVALSSNYIVAGMSSSQSVSQNATIKLNLNRTTYSNGSLLSLDTTNHEVVIGSGVNHVEISGQFYIYSFSGNGLRNLHIYHNNKSVVRNILYISQPYQTIQSSVMTIPVSEGDRISLQIYSQGGTTQISADWNCTELYVRVID